MFSFIKKFFKKDSNHNKVHSKKAFTLPELLAVLGVIGGGTAAAVNPSLILPALGGLGSAVAGGIATAKGIPALKKLIAKKSLMKKFPKYNPKNIQNKLDSVPGLKNDDSISTFLPGALISGSGTAYGLNKLLNQNTNSKNNISDIKSQFPTLFK